MENNNKYKQDTILFNKTIDAIKSYENDLRDIVFNESVEKEARVAMKKSYTKKVRFIIGKGLCI